MSRAYLPDRRDAASGARWPEPRFVARSGAEAECVVERLTGLLWPRHYGRVPADWSAALAQAEALLLCGHDDWRLPYVNELESLVRGMGRNGSDQDGTTSLQPHRHEIGDR